MLVAALAGRTPGARSTTTPWRERMRFYSYGDCMLILPRRREDESR